MLNTKYIAMVNTYLGVNNIKHELKYQANTNTCR